MWFHVPLLVWQVSVRSVVTQFKKKSLMCDKSYGPWIIQCNVLLTERNVVSFDTRQKAFACERLFLEWQYQARQVCYDTVLSIRGRSLQNMADLRDKRLLSPLQLHVQMGSSFVRYSGELVNVSHQTITPGVWEHTIEQPFVVKSSHSAPFAFSVGN